MYSDPLPVPDRVGIFPTYELGLKNKRFAKACQSSGLPTSHERNVPFTRIVAKGLVCWFVMRHQGNTNRRLFRKTKPLIPPARGVARQLVEEFEVPQGNLQAGLSGVCYAEKVVLPSKPSL